MTEKKFLEQYGSGQDNKVQFKMEMSLEQLINVDGIPGMNEHVDNHINVLVPASDMIMTELDYELAYTVRDSSGEAFAIVVVTAVPEKL